MPLIDIPKVAHDQAICTIAYCSRSQLPSVLYRPRLMADGDMWCALYGDDLATGVAGFGKTPAEAMAEFDRRWASERTPAAMLSARSATSGYLR